MNRVKYVHLYFSALQAVQIKKNSLADIPGYSVYVDARNGSRYECTEACSADRSSFWRDAARQTTASIPADKLVCLAGPDGVRQNFIASQEFDALNPVEKRNVICSAMIPRGIQKMRYV